MIETTELRAQWRHLFDPATGVAGPALFYDRLQQALALARREPLAVTLLLVTWDVDGDAPPRDELDPLACAVVSSSVRASDTVGWVDGDRLGVILPNANDEAAPFVASRLMVRLIEGCELDGRRVGLRPYAGLSVARSGQFVPEPGALLGQAQRALEDATAKGGGFAAWQSPESAALLELIRRNPA